MNNKITCVIMDWAGTTVDFGCFAPLQAFIKAFKEERDIDITISQAREPMGLLKVEHIKAILSMPPVDQQFTAKHGRKWNMEDVTCLNSCFEKHLFASLETYTDPIPGVLETIDTLRSKGIKIGSTTGYTAKMMEVVQPSAAAKGYKVDNLVTPDGLPAGRPAPFMIYKNMIDMDIRSASCVIKVGDTIADIKEGVEAKVWSIGVITGSSELGLTIDEYNSIDQEELSKLKLAVREKMNDAGADFVMDNIAQLPEYINKINELSFTL